MEYNCFFLLCWDLMKKKFDHGYTRLYTLCAPCMYMCVCRYREETYHRTRKDLYSTYVDRVKTRAHCPLAVQFYTRYRTYSYLWNSAAVDEDAIGRATFSRYAVPTPRRCGFCHTPKVLSLIVIPNLSNSLLYEFVVNTKCVITIA